MIKRLGLVLECDAGGADELVFRCLTRRLTAEGQEPTVFPVCLGSKKGLMEDAITRAQALVEVDQCGLVLIVWDLKPLWKEADAKKCVDEADLLRAKLQALPAKVRPKIKLLCLTWELETWLLAEERAVRAYLATPAHACDFTTPNRLAQVSDPKSVLNKAFTAFRGKGRRYEDWMEAIRLVQLWPDTSRVRKVPSFARFVTLLTGNATTAFSRCGDACKDLAHQANRMGK